MYDYPGYKQHVCGYFLGPEPLIPVALVSQLRKSLWTHNSLNKRDNESK